MHRTTRLIALLVGLSVISPMPFAVASAQEPAVSVQLINLDNAANLRITLDGTQIFQGASAATPSTVSSVVIGRYQLDGAKPHTLTAESLNTNAKTRLDWTPSRDRDGWVVVTYYPGRAVPNEPPFFMVSLQSKRALVK